MRRNPPTPIRVSIVMGVSGFGKTTIGEALGEALGGQFLDGDTFHTPNNLDKMSRGIPLNDDDRWPWLKQFAREMSQRTGSVVGGCSALKRIYRDHIRQTLGEPVRFIHLTGSGELIAARMAKRTGHFMPMSLLQNQFDTLEVPGADENAMTIDIAGTTAEIVDEICARIALTK